MVLDKCSCGIEYDSEKPLLHLEQVNANAMDDRIPCILCVKTIVANTTKESDTCFICKSSTLKKSKISLWAHILSVHVQSKPYKCEYCDVRVKKKEHLRKHEISIHFGGNKVKCNFCDHVIGKDYLQTHIKNFHSKNPRSFLCQVCGAVFSSEVSYKQHSQLHEDKTYKCPHCDKECPSQARLTWHKSRAHRKKPRIKKELKRERINCEFCDKTVDSHYRLKIHVRNLHERESSIIRPKYPCEYCDRVFKTKTGISEHESTAHGVGTVMYTCGTCEKIFLRSAALYRHMKIHTGEKKFKCDTCGVSFNQKCTLTRHQVVHTGEKPFECGICGQRFTQKPYMKTHEKTHNLIAGSVKKLKKNCTGIKKT